MTFSEALHTCLFKKYANFSGRASRQEFWLFYLFYSAALAVLGSLAAFSFIRSENLSDPLMTTAFYAALIVLILISVALLLPYLGVSVRRLHDLNQSGGWAFLLFVPVFSIALLFGFAFKGSIGENNYGPDPLADLHASLPVSSPILLKQPTKPSVSITRMNNDELNLVNVVKMCFTEKFSCFTGRSSRKEFWLFWLFYAIINVAIAFVYAYAIYVFYDATQNPGYFDSEARIESMARKFVLVILIQSLVFWVFLLPYLGVSVRRLHDLNRTGGLSALLVIPIPFIALPVLIYFLRRGTVGENSFGPDPLDPAPPASPIVIGA